MNTNIVSERLTGLGGTDIGALFGVSPWKDPAKVYGEKTGIIADDPPSIVMRGGIHAEPFIAELFAEAHPELELREVPMLRHPDYPHLIAHPDRHLYCDGKLVKGLEIKKISYRTAEHWGEPGTENIPQHYFLQVQHYMAVDGLDEYCVAGLFDDTELREYPIKRHDGMIAKMVEAGDAFWCNHIIPRIAPEPDGTEGYTKLLKSMYPADDPALVMVGTAETDALIEKMFRLEKDSKEAAVSHEAAKNQIKALMENNSILISDKYRITWKKSKDGTKLDRKGLLLELDVSPELLGKYTTPRTGSRRFLPKVL